MISPASMEHGKRAALPLTIKVIYTAFMAVLVPVYLVRYGPTNFLYFCDLALLITLAALWLESSFLASVAAVGILAAQTLWVIDLLCGFAGFHPIGMTNYMFDATLPIAVRMLSLFHGWLPILLLWIVHRLGYDRRAFLVWTAIGTLLMLICYLFIPPPPAPLEQPHLPVNINLVYGPSDDAPQRWMPPNLYVLALITLLPLLFYWPTHWLLRRFFDRDRTRSLSARAD